MEQCIVVILGLSGHSFNTVFPLQLHKLIWPVHNMLFASKHSFATLTISSPLILTPSSVMAVGGVCRMRISRFIALASELFDLSTHACICAWISTRLLKLNMFQAEFPVSPPHHVSKWQLYSSSCSGPNLGLFFDSPLSHSWPQSDNRFRWICLWNQSTTWPLLSSTALLLPCLNQ